VVWVVVSFGLVCCRQSRTLLVCVALLEDQWLLMEGGEGRGGGNKCYGNKVWKCLWNGAMGCKRKEGRLAGVGGKHFARRRGRIGVAWSKQAYK